MIRLILMRHGNTFEEGETPVQIGKATDLPLTQFGHQQAETMAQYLLLNKIRPKAIFAGPLKRQMQSASQIASHFDLSITPEPALTEIDYGAWEGLTAEEISSRWPSLYMVWAKEGLWPEGIFKSSQDSIQIAMNQWLTSLKQSFTSGDTVLAVSSNGLLQLLHKGKVKTGHFCDLSLYPNQLIVNGWNIAPNVNK